MLKIKLKNTALCPYCRKAQTWKVKDGFRSFDKPGAVQQDQCGSCDQYFKYAMISNIGDGLAGFVSDLVSNGELSTAARKEFISITKDFRPNVIFRPWPWQVNGIQDAIISTQMMMERSESVSGLLIYDGIELRILEGANVNDLVAEFKRLKKRV